MTTPTDDDNGDANDSILDEAAHDELLRQAIEEKMARLGPEEGRKWRERMLAFLTQEEIVERQTPDDDGERG